MKIIILGPVICNNQSGGVAVFDEGLYNAFASIGHDVFLISNQKSDNVNNAVFSTSFFKFGFSKIAKAIKKEKPDLIIASLQFALGIKWFKKAWPQGTYVLVLHGFSCPINGKFRAWAINNSLKHYHKYFDHVVSVSSLTFAINNKINCINSDKIIFNGIDTSKVKFENTDKEYDFVYVGRLFRDKGITMICDALTEIIKKKPFLKVAIAGYGEESASFEPGGIYHNSGFTYLGNLTNEQVGQLLDKSRFLISMNSLEPFGLVFTEAIIHGCNIITQSTSGCSAKFIKKNYFHICDAYNSKELSVELEKILNNYVDISIKERKKVAFEMSFENCAKQYAALRKNH